MPIPKEDDVVWLENYGQIGVVERVKKFDSNRLDITLKIPKRSRDDGINHNHISFIVLPENLKILSAVEAVEKIYELFNKSLEILLQNLLKGNEEVLRTYKL